jgi:hypothetical protein
MTDFRGNIDHWMKQSEPDYYLFFLKAWIPFNAWYIAELPHLEKKDTLIIKELQENPKSKPRNIIENYLTSTNSKEANRFKEHLAGLHNCLESKPVIHNGFRLSFTSLSLMENPIKVKKDIDIKGNIYKAEIKSGFIQALIVDKGNRTLLDFKQSKYKIDDLEIYDDFIRLKTKLIKNKILDCYKEINPSKTISLLSQSKTKGDFIVIDPDNKLNFINDPVIISKGCLKILYALRCMLFHGEIEPTNSNKPIYEHAYYLLRLIIKELN